MICSKCQTENREGRRFCAECGAALETACSACGFTNYLNEKFCGGCGQKLAAAEPASPVVTAAPDSAREAEESHAEKRILTVLFCDLANSTVMSEQLDVEILNRLNRAYQDSCTRIIESFDGYVARYMGDGILAYFGYPTASENDTECAISAALAMSEAIAKMELDYAAGVTLATRIGIATGPVVVGEVVGDGASRESTAVGKTPNLAARLQSAAGLNQVFVADETRQLAGSLFEFESAGKLELKGIDAPQQVWQVLGAASHKSRFEAFSSVGFTPWVGRQHELGLARSCWHEVRQGHGQVMLLSGEPGIGKSRLVQRILELCEGYPPGIFQCSPHRLNSAWSPVIDYLRAQVDNNTAASLRDLLDGCGITDPDAHALVSNLLSLDSDSQGIEALPPALRKQKTFDALLRLLTQGPEERPRVLVVEDLHWIDPTSEELFNMLVSQLESLPVLLLLTYRPEYQAGWVGRQHVHLLALNRIGQSHCREIVRSIAGDNYSDELAERIIERTDGIPLFVEELTRSVMAGQSEEGQSAAIPMSLADSLNRRLDALGSARRLARAAAVIGRVFNRDTVRAIVRQSEQELDEGFEKLLASGLVYTVGPAELGIYQFKHALIQDAAYEGLLNEQKSRFHLRAAKYLETLLPTDSSVSVDVIAHHFQYAGCNREARKYLCLAGKRSLSVSAADEALAYFRRADSLPLEERTDEDLRVDLDVNLGMAACLRLHEKYNAALKRLEQAESYALRLNAITALSDICNTRGNLYFPLGETEGCLAAHQQSLEYAETANDRARQVRAIGGLGDAHYLRGEMRAATDYFIRCCGQADEYGYPELAAANTSMIGWSRVFALEFPEAYENALEGIARSEACGHIRGMMNSQTLACCISGEMGNDELAERHEQRAMELANKLGSKNFAAAITFFRYRGFGHEHSREKMRESLQKALEVSRKFGHGFHGPSIIGDLMLMTDDKEIRDQLAREAEAILDASCVGHNYYWYYRDAIDVSIQHRNWRDLEHNISRMLAYDGDRKSAWCRFYSERAELLRLGLCGQWSRSLDGRLDVLIAEGERHRMVASLRALLELKAQLA